MPYVTKCNAKHQMKRCTHWTLETQRRVLWSDESRFSVWKLCLGLVVARGTVLVSLHCAKCEVWWRGLGWGALFRSGSRDLNSTERSS